MEEISNHKAQFERWKEEAIEYGIKDLNKDNSKLILQYVLDMEEGKNTARGSKKGGRGYQRLNTIRSRMCFLTKEFEKRGLKDLTKVNEDFVITFFHDMKTGNLKKLNGGVYKSSADYVKVFKSFYHWFEKVNRKKGNIIQDITLDLDTSYDENSFVYFTLEQMQEMLPYFTSSEQIRILFNFDTIIRSGKELINVQVSDISSDFKELTIKEESSKTFGRRIKLLLCSDALKKYIKEEGLKGDDYVFKFDTQIGKRMKKVAVEVFGDKMTQGGKKFSEISLYDCRHSGACYWRTGAYRSKIDALMYRGGWKDLTMLNYYTKKIGMKDTIEKEDMLIGFDKSEWEKRLELLEKELLIRRKREFNEVGAVMEGW